MGNIRGRVRRARPRAIRSSTWPSTRSSPSTAAKCASQASTTATASTASASCRTPRANGRYRTRSKTAALDGKTGSLHAVSARRRTTTARFRCATSYPLRLCRRHAVLLLRHDLLCLDASAAGDAGADAGDAEEDALQQDAHGRVPEGLSLQRQRAAAPDLPCRQGRQGGLRPPEPGSFPALREPGGGAPRPRHRGRHHHLPPLRPLGLLQHVGGAGLPLCRLPRGPACRLPQRLVVARQRVRLPARHEAA